MCLYPRFIKNKRYLPTKKNNYNPPTCNDKRMLLVPIGCGNCIECRQQKAREWRVRLCNEIKEKKYKYFVTLTFSEDSINELCNITKTTECNAIASIAVRRFLERWRKKYKKSVTHWLITELGHKNTERIHLHGIIIPKHEMSNEELASIWKYGKTDNGKYVNIRTINYIVKYVTKIDVDHKGFQPQIFCSAGIGKQYMQTYNLKKIHEYKKGKTQEFITMPNGTKLSIPIYLRNKIWDEKTREKLWADRLDRGIIYVRGIPCKVTNAEKQKRYFKLLREQQKLNVEFGYGTDGNEWKAKEYNATLRMLNIKPTK